MSTDAPDPSSREPLISVGTITAVVTAILALLVAFGLNLSDDQQAAVLGFIAVAAPVAVALAARGKVYAPATVAQMLRDPGTRQRL